MSLDLDAIFCMFSVNKFFTSFKSSFQLDLRKENLQLWFNKIKGSFDYNVNIKTTANIKKLPNLKIDVSYTNLGILNVYLLSPVLDKISQQEFELMMFDAISNNIKCNTSSFISKQTLQVSNEENKISGILNNEDLNLLFKELDITFKKCKFELYVESFGNKMHAVTDLTNFDFILQKLKHL